MTETLQEKITALRRRRLDRRAEIGRAKRVIEEEEWEIKSLKEEVSDIEITINHYQEVILSQKEKTDSLNSGGRIKLEGDRLPNENESSEPR